MRFNRYDICTTHEPNYKVNSEELMIVRKHSVILAPPPGGLMNALPAREKRHQSAAGWRSARDRCRTG